MEYSCLQCAKRFWRYSSQVRNKERVFCGQSCKNIWQKTSLTGRMNPNFRSGAFSDPKCTSCGKTKDPRSKKCSRCAKRGYGVGKKGKVLGEDEIRIAITKSNSFMEAAARIGATRHTLTKYASKIGIDLSHFQPGRGRYLPPEQVLINGSIMRHGTVKKLIQRLGLLPYACSICRISDWLTKELVLEIDHINGNSRDNRIENLRYLCPNCHSQTTTYCGRNNRNRS